VKTLKGLVGLLGMVLVSGTGAGWAEKVASLPAPTGYVDDYARVISAPAKSDLEGLCRELHDKTRAQVFLVTVKTLDGETVEMFANQLFARWKIGEKKTDRGVLLLLAINDHKRWIEVGYGFEGILNDAKVGDIGREMVPALKVSNFDEAARIGVRDISRVIATEASVKIAALEEVEDIQGGAGKDPDTAPAAPDRVGRPSSSPVWPFVVLPGFFVLVFGLIFWGAIRNRRRGTGGGGGFYPGGFDSGSGFGGDSGSGFGGGSGGGDSFGGGDGGSSGGGGAGGDW
jgi:uncharacterized protein